MSSPAFAQGTADPPPVVEPPLVVPPPATPSVSDPYAAPPPTVPPPTMPSPPAPDPYAGYPSPDGPRPAPPQAPPFGAPYGNPYGVDPNACGDCTPNYVPAPPPSYVPTPPPVPARPARDSRRIRLLVGGLTLFGTAWMSTALDAAFGTTPLVLIPLAGPILATVDYQQNYAHTANVQLESVLLVFDAAAQTAGLIMAIVGGSMKPRPRRVNVSWAGTGVRGSF